MSAPFAMPFSDNTGLLVIKPKGWNFFSPEPGQGTLPLLIYPQGKLEIEESQLLFKEAILVDILDSRPDLRLEDLIKEEVDQLENYYGWLTIQSTTVMSSMFGFRYPVLKIGGEESDKIIFLAFSLAGEKVIKIILLTHPETYENSWPAFFFTLMTLQPLPIHFDQDILRLQSKPVFTLFETDLRQKLLDKSPYEYWAAYRPETEVRFKHIQKFSGYQLNFEKSFKVISVDDEGVVMELLFDSVNSLSNWSEFRTGNLEKINVAMLQIASSDMGLSKQIEESFRSLASANLKVSLKN